MEAPPGDSMGMALSMPVDDSPIVDDPKEGPAPSPSPLAKPKTRSLSDGGGTPSKLSPSPFIIESARRTSKDDSNIHTQQPSAPVTPRRPDFATRGLSLHMPPRAFTPPPGAASGAYVKAAPLSPQLDHSQIYASPTNILPRRSRGLDFSRAATSLHHSTLAEQSSPDSSPTMGGRAMNIPSRRSIFGGGPEQTSSSLWSMMGNQEKMNISTSVGSTQALLSDSSSSSDDDDVMDEDMDEAYVTTPQISKTVSMAHAGPFGSPAMNNFTSFQQRRKGRKHIQKIRGPIGLGFNGTGPSISRSPPNNSTRTRRESISWQANQLHISTADGEENSRGSSEAEGMGSDGQRNVVRRPVTRRGNLLPKTKTFARIRAALAEESAPADAECKREAEVVKQVRDDVDLDHRPAPIPISTQDGQTAATTALSSPNQELLDDIPEDDMMGDLAAGLSSSFKQQAMKNSKGKSFWDTFSESSSVGGNRTTPPPASILPRGSSSGVSDDAAMDSPSIPASASFAVWGSTPGLTDPQRVEIAQIYGPQPPSAAEITRRINNKRRREDDFDPNIFKRRAVSPGLSVHNSPGVQSPMQREVAPWGSRPGSNNGEKGGSSAPSEAGSHGGTPGNPSTNSSSSGRPNNKGRVGFQGMVDTNDGIMRMSIE